MLFLSLFLACGEDNKEQVEEVSCTEQCETDECIELCEFDKRCKKEIDPTSYAIVLGVCGPSPESCQRALSDFQENDENQQAYCNERNCISDMDNMSYPHCWGIWLE